MSTTVLKTNEHIASKVHNSDVSDLFDFMITRDEKGKRIVDMKEITSLGITAEEVIIIQKHIDNKFKINIGDKYRCQSGVYDGDFYYVKCPCDLYEIIDKYDLYYED